MDELKFYKNINDFIKKIILCLIKIYYTQSDAIVGISKKLSNDLGNYINSKVITIYNPSYEEKIIKNYNFQNIKINNKKKIILNVGFFEIQKDQITILKSINILKKHYNNFLLILVGDGSEYKNLENYIKKNNLKRFIKIYKNIQNPSLLFKKADLFVFSSVYEGLGNVLVEAIKYKCPIITSNCNAGPMEIIKNGKYGDYFFPGDYRTLAVKILNHLKNPKRLKKKLKVPKKVILVNSHLNKIYLVSKGCLKKFNLN